jgi:deoxycytidine triphosphate deaminase
MTDSASKRKDLATRRKEQLEKVLSSAPLEDDSILQEHGILLSDQISYLASKHDMISPFQPENLKPAGYELTVGDEYFMSGEFFELKDSITILPFEVAVIKTGELLRLPRFMIARWNIRVTHAYAGLLWVGGPQVDPGYVGNLFCPIYNLSDKPVTLNRGDKLALMDFQRTTKFDTTKPENELVRYPFPAKRLILQDYDIRDFQSALFTRAGRKLDEFEDSIKALETRFITFTQISFAMFAIFLTLLTIYTKVGLTIIETTASLFGAAIIALSVMTFLMTGFSYLQFRLARLIPDRYGAVMAKRALDARRFLRFYWLWGFVLMLVVSLAVGAVVYRVVDPYFEAMRKGSVEAFATSTVDRIDNVERRLSTMESGRRALDETQKSLEDARKEIGALRDELTTLKSVRAPSEPLPGRN